MATTIATIISYRFQNQHSQGGYRPQQLFDTHRPYSSKLIILTPIYIRHYNSFILCFVYNYYKSVLIIALLLIMHPQWQDLGSQN